MGKKGIVSDTESKNHGIISKKSFPALRHKTCNEQARHFGTSVKVFKTIPSAVSKTNPPVQNTVGIAAKPSRHALQLPINVRKHKNVGNYSLLLLLYYLKFKNYLHFNPCKNNFTQLWVNVFSFLDQKQLMPLRMVCKDWKRKIDIKLERKSLQMWLPKTTNFSNFSITTMLEKFSRDSAFFRFCCLRDIQTFQADFNLRSADPKQVIMPGKSIMIGSTQPCVPLARRMEKCGKLCKNRTKYGLFDPPHYPLQIPENFFNLLQQLKQNLNIVVISNLEMNSGFTPREILSCFERMLNHLSNIQVLVLHNAFACFYRKSLRTGGRPLCIPKVIRPGFPNLKKLVVSGGSTDVIEYAFYRMGPYLEELTLVQPFILQHPSVHSSLLTPLRNQIDMLQRLTKLTLEIGRGYDDLFDTWMDFAKLLKTGLRNLVTLSVTLVDFSTNNISKVMVLASNVPNLKNLKLYVENQYMTTSDFSHEIDDNGFLNLTRLCVGSNMLQSNVLCGLLHYLRLMKNVRHIVFEDIGFEDISLVSNKMDLQRICNQLDLFATLPCLKSIKATVNYHSVEIFRN